MSTLKNSGQTWALKIAEERCSLPAQNSASMVPLSSGDGKEGCESALKLWDSRDVVAWSARITLLMELNPKPSHWDPTKYNSAVGLLWVVG